MSLNRYRVFTRIAETGNMRRTAQEMMYTQQAVSRIVKCMEEEWGFPLFIRERDGVRLTAEAERILPLAKELVAVEDRMLASVSEIQAEEGLIKSVRVGACGSIVMQTMKQALAKLRKTHPEISVAVVFESNDDKRNEDLRNGDLDCMLVIEGTQGDLDFKPLYEEHFVAVMTKDHPLADHNQISINELMQHYCVITRESPYYDEIMDNSEQNTVVVDEELMMLPVISEGLVVAIMTGRFDENMYKNMKVVPLEESHSRTIGIATKPGVPLSDSAQIFVDVLKTII